MILYTTVLMAVWVFALTIMVLGTISFLAHSGKGPKHLDAPFNLFPVSILKPLKGIDDGLEDNLRSFFALDYPDYELLFSVSDAADPAVYVVSRLLGEFPSVKARLIVSKSEIGINPKVNNLAVTYKEARNDWILISDSNVRVDSSYLKQMMAEVDSNAGVVTSIVAGRHGEGVGGRLNANFLNTFYARWMALTYLLGRPCVVGKAMLFNRKEFNRFGGLTVLSRYLAEDYMAGEAVRKLGKRVVISSRPVDQYIGNQSFFDFWSRHLRWGRIRKAQAPLAFSFEPLFSFVLSGLFGAIAISAILGCPIWAFAAFHVGLWSLCDLALNRKLDPKLSWKSIPVWLLRELLYLPMWLHISLGNTVEWRGKRLIIESGGLVRQSMETSDAAISLGHCHEQPSN